MADAKSDLPLAVGPTMTTSGEVSVTIVTVIAEGRRDESLGIVEQRLRAVGVEVRNVYTLGGSVAELRLLTDDVDGIRPLVGAIPDTDIFVQRHHHRPPELFVADMDSTMIGQECIDELAAEVGIKDRVAAITERAMRGELDFAAALRERLALLEGLDVGVIDKLLEERIRPNPGAQELLSGLKGNGVRCVLVSGGFTHFANPIGRLLGFDRVVANRLEVVNGKLTGQVEGEIVDARTKRRILEEEAGRNIQHSVAIGDGANDLDMMKAAGLGIAYRAKPKVAAEADARLDHHDLDRLLYAFGLKG